MMAQALRFTEKKSEFYFMGGFPYHKSILQYHKGFNGAECSEEVRYLSPSKKVVIGTLGLNRLEHLYLYHIMYIILFTCVFINDYYHNYLMLKITKQGLNLLTKNRVLRLVNIHLFSH